MIPDINDLTPTERTHYHDLSLCRVYARWFPIETAPKNQYILLAGPSGYLGTPLRVEVARWAESHGNWRNHAFDAFTDGGPEPTHWMPLPEPL